MKNLIDASLLIDKITKRRIAIIETVDYADVADYELNWIEGIIQENQQTPNAFANVSGGFELEEIEIEVLKDFFKFYNSNQYQPLYDNVLKSLFNRLLKAQK